MRRRQKLSNPLFRSLDFAAIADDIRRAERSVCYAAPGIQRAPADAMVEVAGKFGPECITSALILTSG
jgi:hypothetical protein